MKPKQQTQTYIKLTKKVFDNLDKGSLIKVNDTYSKYSNRFKIRLKKPLYVCTIPIIVNEMTTSEVTVNEVNVNEVINTIPIITPNYNKTKKKKNGISSSEKNRLLDIFKTECQEETTMVYDQKKESGCCHLCASILMIMDDGFPTCSNPQCGIIYRNTLDYSPEWRFYGAEDKNSNDPTRCGNPINPLLVESSYGCKVLCTNKSSYEMKTIRKWTEWQSMPHKEKSLYDEFQYITIMAQNAGIPKIFIDDAMARHKEISEQKMFRGMNRDGIKAASIYISCRLNGCPRTAHEIAEIFMLDKTSATNGCTMAVNILSNIERNNTMNDSGNKNGDLCATTPSSFIERYCSKLNVTQELTLLSKFIAKKIEDNRLICDNVPHAISAGIVYFICQLSQSVITKTDIKNICGVSEVTINKCYKKIENMKNMLIPDCILTKYSLI
jgi:transcription initiation factor TFIIB